MSIKALAICMNMRFGVVIFLICLGHSLSFAQKGYELGAWIGASHYFGDLNTNYDLTKPGIAAGITGRYNFDNRFSARLSLNYGNLRGDDANSDNTFEQMRNLNFSSILFDISPLVELNFLPYTHGSKDEFFTPYLLAGASFFYYNPKTELDGVTYSLRDFGTEGQGFGEEYGSFSWAYTFGAGVKWDINEDWSFNVELSLRKTFADYIDDVSTEYPNFNRLLVDRGQVAVDLSDRSIGQELGESNRQRGEAFNNDNYSFFSIGIMKYFGKLECPTISRKF